MTTASRPSSRNPPATGVPPDWNCLFEPCDAGGAHLTTRTWLALEKRGHPFLLLPSDPTLARRALTLYPAQTVKARCARTLLGAALRLRMPMPLKRVEQSFQPGDTFAGFLTNLADTPSLPEFAILSGNPKAPGRRFVLLMFDSRGLPTVVVKAGADEEAKSLIRKERAFLQSRPTGAQALPIVLGEFASDRVEAFALGFVEGPTPSPKNAGAVAPLLRSWAVTPESTPLSRLPAWKRLADSAAKDPRFHTLQAALKAAQPCPVLYHGDFAPWNIRVTPATGKWTVLDWERGEHEGIPGWDWFHYETQRALLVDRESPTTLGLRLEALLTSPDFRDYAQATRIAGIEQDLLLAYLLHSIHVLRPAEGLAATQQLLDCLIGRWKNVSKS